MFSLSQASPTTNNSFLAASFSNSASLFKTFFSVFTLAGKAAFILLMSSIAGCMAFWPSVIAS